MFRALALRQSEMKRELSQLLEPRLARPTIAVLVLIRSVVFQACDKPLALLD